MSCVTCQVSHVRAHVTCHITSVTFFLSGEASWWSVCYQQGLPDLVNRPGVAGAVL